MSLANPSTSREQMGSPATSQGLKGKADQPTLDCQEIVYMTRISMNIIFLVHPIIIENGLYI